MSRKKRIGVYKIIHNPTGRCYIGASNDIVNRFGYHRFVLRRGQHSSPELQQLWDRDGENAFSFIEIEYCCQEDLRIREQAWHDATRDTLNFVKGSARRGPIVDAKRSELISKAIRNAWMKPEYRSRHEARLYGYVLDGSNRRKSHDPR